MMRASPAAGHMGLPPKLASPRASGVTWRIASGAPEDRSRVALRTVTSGPTSGRAWFPIATSHGIPSAAMAKRFKAAIIGGSGYGGAEMARRLLMHPDVELVRVASIDHVGEPLGTVHPNLDGATDLVFEDLAPAEAARGCDVALLALPHKVTAAKVPELIATGVKIVDMSGDFRLRDAATYEKFYAATHPHPELLGTFVYGLPELNRAEIKKAKYVASPGCFATAMELALLP